MNVWRWVVGLNDQPWKGAPLVPEFGVRACHVLTADLGLEECKGVEEMGSCWTQAE